MAETSNIINVNGSTHTIAESEYVFTEQALALAGNFLPLGDASMLKSGMFGYTTAVMAHMARDSTFHRDMLYDEFFLTRARLNSTLYTWAKTLNKEISLATPARMDVVFKMPLIELQSLAKLQPNGNYSYTISRDTVFDVAGIKFLLPYSVRILFYANTTGSMNISAFYVFDDYNYKDSSITSPYLKMVTTDENGVDMVNISLTIFQLEKSDWVFTISSNDILDAGIIEQRIGENLVSFRASYQESTYYRDLEMIFNELDTPKTSTFGYYTLIGDDTIRLYFSSKLNEFRPVFNSKIKLETFTTKGEAGNFNYTGSISVRDSNINKKTYAIYPLTSKSTGGSSAAAFVENKKKLINALRSRDNIITDYDVTSYFEEQRKLRIGKDSRVTAHKVRDDFFRRQYSLFLLNKTSEGHVVPSNTINLSMSIDDIENLGYAIKPGTLIIYDRVESRYRLLEEDELPEIYMNSADNYVYCVPFLIKFDFKEFPKVDYYLTNYTRTVPLSYKYFNIESPYEIIVNSYNIKRRPMYDDNAFTVGCTINTVSTDLSKVKVRAIVKDEHGNALGYFDLKREEKSSNFSAQLFTNDRFNSDGFYLLENCVHDISSGTLISDFPVGGSYKIDFGVFIEDSTLNTSKSGVFTEMRDLDSYATLIELTSDEAIAFADDMGGMMYSQLAINEATGRIDISKVPVVSALFYLNDQYNTGIMNEIYDIILMAREIVRKLENKTSIDLKFYNTSGISRYFDIDTTDISLRLSIALTSYTPTKELEERIKLFIVNFIEGRNDNIDKRFSISNLISALEGNFPEIKYIKFFSTNGANIQNIEALKSSSEEDPNYVPEFITVRKLLPKSAASSNFDYDITLDYV